MQRIGVVGAAGRMGSEVCRAVAAAPDLELVAAVDPAGTGRSLAEVAGIDSGLTVSGELGDLLEADAEVVVEFTGPDSVGDNLAWLLEHGRHAVVGATGITEVQLRRARELAAAGTANALIAPNFAIGAVLLLRFASEAVRYLPDVEIVDLHHDRKVDAPSGTALRAAEMISRSRDGTPVPGDRDAARGLEHHGVRVHSVRLPGLVAHHEIVFGGEGQTLTLRHDSLDRSSFMPGVLLACRRVSGLEGLVVGLDQLL